MKILFFVLLLAVNLVAMGQQRNPGARGGSQEDRRHSSVPISNSERPAGRTVPEVLTSQPIDPPVYQPVVHVPVSMTIIQAGVVQGVIHPATNLQVILKNAADFSGSAGYDFSEATILSCDDKDADMVLEQTVDGFAVFVPEDGDIQDFGRTNSIDDISTAPRAGWSETKSVSLSVEHSYAVRTWEKKYYKFRIAAVWQDGVLFDWAVLTPWRGGMTRSNERQSVANRFPR